MAQHLQGSRATRYVALRLLMGGLYITAGTLHFLLTPLYMAIMPHSLPAHRLLVLVSGAAEITGGVGVLMPWPVLRRAAAWGLIALLCAVFPANVQMAMEPRLFPSIPQWALWLRLPLQLPLLYWAWIYTREPAG